MNEKERGRIIERITRGRNHIHQLAKEIGELEKDLARKESKDISTKSKIHTTVKSILRQKAKAIKDRAAKRRSEVSYREQELEELREGITTIPDLERKIQILEK